MHAAFGDDDDKIRCIGAVLCALTHAITERGVPPLDRPEHFWSTQSRRTYGRSEGKGREGETKPNPSSRRKKDPRRAVVSYALWSTFPERRVPFPQEHEMTFSVGCAPL